MKVQYLSNSVEIGPNLIIIRKGLKKIVLARSAILGIEHKPLLGTTIFVTVKKRYKVSLYHGHKQIVEELMK